MNNNLPEQNTPQTNGEESLSPRISLFITERFSFQKTTLYTKMFFVSFLSGILVFNIIFQVTVFVENAKKVQSMKNERVAVSKEIQYWKQTAAKYDGYRDAYFRLAALEYKVGAVNESKQYMEKTLELDPNFEAGRVLGEKIQR